MKNKKLFCFGMAAVMALSVGALAACGGEPEQPAGDKGSLLPTEAYEMPIKEDAQLRTTDVSVHDPSVFYDPIGKKYYAFGTHYAVASSEDLITWTQEAKDNKYEVLYGEGCETVTYSGAKWPKALDETLSIVKPEDKGKDTITTTWAPDVNYYNGKYYMYYSITKAFGSNQSAIGRVESDNVLGPYSNNRVILESVTMTEAGHVNCIDPELFTDKDGKLWMVYGSHYAGVYIKELYNEGANWGLPKEEGTGKLLWKGGAAVVEGPFVFYNELTGYYYLMTSYGALMEDYNMRIARSENPDGPYVDITGADMALTEGTSNGTLHGNKVAGSYKFEGQSGPAYAAMGHNSVVQSADGRWFVVYHTRRQTGDEVDGAHNLMVNQLFFNEDKWPVMSPVAYSSEKFGKITQEEAAGEYDLLIHTTGTNITIATSEKYTLAADGTVTKGTAEAGTWSIKNDFYVTITVNEVEYKGVIVPGWNTYMAKNRQTPVFAITAISKLEDQGGSLWAICPQD